MSSSSPCRILGTACFFHCSNTCRVDLVAIMEVVWLNLLITSFYLRSYHANIMPSTNGCTSLRSDSSIPCRRSWSDKYAILIWSALIECSMAKGTCLFIPSVSVFIADFSGGHPPLTAGLELPSSLTLSGGSCVGILFFPLLFSLMLIWIWNLNVRQNYYFYLTGHKNRGILLEMGC